MKLLILLASLSLFLQQVHGQQAQIWTSQPDKGLMLVQQPNLSFEADTSSSVNTININPSIKYQEIDGFGASMTDSSAWLLKYKLSASKRTEILNKVFSPSGINLSLLRQPIGGTDFATRLWTFADVQGATAMDYELKNFSTLHEEQYIRPMLDLGLAVNPGRVKLMASPWSPPAWMKTKRDLLGETGGILRKDCYESYANYFVKYVQDNAKNGREIYAITVQNEPQYAPWAYPGMLMSSSEQIDFIANYLGPKFEKLGIKTKIISFDHNYDAMGVAFAYDVLRNASANKYVAGTGFHIYVDVPAHEKMSEINAAFPDKGLWITEAGSGTWIGNGSDAEMFQDQMMHLIRGPRNYARGVILWNIALDQNSSPKLPGVDPDPGSNRGFMTIRSDMIDSVKFEMSYYSMGHTSKFVDPGARRIDSNWSKGDLENAAYQNPDNSVAVVVCNKVATPKQIKIMWNNKSVSFSLTGFGAATVKWQP